MLLTFYIVQAMRFLTGLFFLYQCGIFIFYFFRGWMKGENGITGGLLVLYIALLAAGVSAVIDGLAFWLEFFYSPGLLPDPSAYLMAVSLIRLIFVVTGCIGNHLLYFALRKAS